MTLVKLSIRMVENQNQLELAAIELCRVAHWCAAKGWVPATSGNFSVRVGDHLRVTVSGLDKSSLTLDGLLEMTLVGHITANSGTAQTARPSAETILHRILYQERLEANAILHTHSVWNTLLSTLALSEGESVDELSIHGYEILKALSGVTTHEHTERIPVLRNSQDYSELGDDLREALRANTEAHGFLLSGHGLYTWGRTVDEAKRHLEALEFLFEVEARRIFGNRI